MPRHHAGDSSSTSPTQQRLAAAMEAERVEPPPADSMVIRIHSAADLRSADRRSQTSDPFVEVFFEGLADRDASVGETVVRKKTLQPSWEDQPPLELQVPARAHKGEGRALVFHVLDHDHVGRNNILGEAQLSVEDWRLGCTRKELPLKQQQFKGSASRSDADEPASGVIVVSCEWTGAVGADAAPKGPEATELPTGAGTVPRGNDAEISSTGDAQSGSGGGGGGGASGGGSSNSSSSSSGGGGGGGGGGDDEPPGKPSGEGEGAVAAAASPPLGPCEIFVRVHEGRDFASTDWTTRTGAKNASFAPFVCKNDHFTKTGSGRA